MPQSENESSIGTPVKRRGRPRAENASSPQQAVVKAALSLFKTKGLEGTSVDEIAAKAGSSKTTIYRHFGGKDGLAEAAVIRDGQRLAMQFKRTKITETAPLPRIRERVAALVELTAGKDNSSLFRLCISSVPRLPALGREFLHTRIELEKVFFDDLRAAQAEGALRAGPVEDVASSLYELVVQPRWLGGLLRVETEAVRTREFARSWDRFLTCEGCDQPSCDL